MKEHALDQLHLLTVEQVAEKLGVSTRTIRRLIKQGRIVAHRVGRCIRVDGKSVTRFLESSKVEVSFGPKPWQVGSAGTYKESRIFPDNEESRRSGRATSTAERSRSALQMQPKPNGVSSPLPQNAAELRRALRQLRLPN